MAKNLTPDKWAEMADLILVIAREIQFRGYSDERAQALTPSEGMVMRHTQAEPDTTFPRLVEATGLLRTNLSTVLRGLERKGLIERRITPEDRRVTTVHLTERGRENYEIVRREWGAELARAAELASATGPTSATMKELEHIKDGLVALRPTRGSAQD